VLVLVKIQFQVCGELGGELLEMSLCELDFGVLGERLFQVCVQDVEVSEVVLVEN